MVGFMVFLLLGCSTPPLFLLFLIFLFLEKLHPGFFFFFFDFSIEQQNKFLSLLQAYLIVAAAVDFVAAY